MFTTLAIIAGIVFLVFIHELGHFLAARACKIKVTDFFIGFGPKIFSFKRGDTTYGIASIPLGAYVKINGSDLLEEESEEGPQITQDKANDNEVTLRNVSLIKKFFIIAAGSVMNILFAFIILAVALGFSGINKPTTSINSISKDYPAYGVLKPGDKILAINGHKTNSWEKVSLEIRKHPNENIKIQYLRKGQTKEVFLKTKKVGSVGKIGVSPSAVKVRNLTIFESLKTSFLIIYQTIVAINNLLIKALTGEPGALVKNTQSIVGAVALGAQISKTFFDYLFIIGSISLALGYFNLLPIPPLDGGRLFLYIIERVKGKALKLRTIIAVNAIGLALMLTAVSLLLVRDIIRLSQ